MEEIVAKLAEPSPQADVVHQGLDAQATVNVRAETIGGHRKLAEAWLRVGSDDLSRWRIHSDEGELIGGEDSAPPPLVYFGAAIAF